MYALREERTIYEKWEMMKRTKLVNNKYSEEEESQVNSK